MSFYVPNPDFADEVLRSSEVKELVTDLAERGADLYAEGVPRAEGDLADSIFSDVALTPDRYAGRVGATDYKAGLIELGTSRNPPNGALRRALESLGLDVDEIQL